MAIVPTTVTAAHLQPHLLFSAKMNGAQQVPAVTTTALGLGGLTLNATRDTLCVNIGWTGLSSALTGLHIHQGAAGTNGPVLWDLGPSIVGDRVMTTLTAPVLTQELIEMHLRGELYLNLHTVNNPNGEIRGQILPETDHAYTASLDGMQQVPQVMTSAFGLGTFQLARHNGTFSFNVVLNGLSGPIDAAHFHTGAAGTNGPVIQDLAAFINGNTIAGSVDPTAFLADLMAGNIYLNVHTTANPNGEIRGQLLAPLGMPFDATLTGAQQVPAVITDARGSATLVASLDMDSIWYDVVVDGLSGPIQAAHLHNGALGTNGPVVIDIADGINGNRISGWITTATNEDIMELLEGNLYINVHTTMNPNGEIRGQVYRYMREGYTVAMDGSQQVPMVTTTASGAGIVSVDRGQTNAHIMFVTNAEMVQAAHFHLGVAGTNGPVVFDMSGLLMDNGVFTYWKSTDITPFLTANSVQFRNDSLYLNVHTTANPNGEVRGQVLRGAVCGDGAMGLLERPRTVEELAAWPVPANERITIALPSVLTGNVTLEFIDALGAVVATHTVNTSTGTAVLDVADLTTGLYFARLTTSDRVYATRFTKE